jgi:hypothetical protein
MKTALTGKVSAVSFSTTGDLVPPPKKSPYPTAIWRPRADSNSNPKKFEL